MVARMPPEPYHSSVIINPDPRLSIDVFDRNLGSLDLLGSPIYSQQSGKRESMSVPVTLPYYSQPTLGSSGTDAQRQTRLFLLLAPQVTPSIYLESGYLSLIEYVPK
jgi:hypothetical protein